ncbi:MAG TPA: EAL domain-containing protein [Arenimonas sp.]|nr:EAL domain-containing protein [Arenimonas sp.]
MDKATTSPGLSRRGAGLLSAGALLLGLLASLGAAHWHQQTLREDQQQRHLRLAERSFDALATALNTCGLLLRSVQSTFLASDEVTADEFSVLQRNLDTETNFPSLQALGYARREVDAEGKERFITDRVAPLLGNERLVGLDITSQPANMVAVFASRDSNQPAMSATFQLIQRAGLPGFQDGVTIRLPVYAPGLAPVTVRERQRQFKGSLVASFHVSGLIEGALPEEVREELRIEVIDVTAGLDKRLFEWLPPDASALDAGKLEWMSSDIPFGGRVWRMRLAAATPPARLAGWPLLTLIGGALASLLAAGLLWSLLGTRARALAIAERMSAQYRDSEARLRALSEQLAWQAHHDDLTALGNRRAFQVALEQAIRSVDAGGPPLALLYLDLDQFKLVNDTSGHSAGDELLAQLAIRLQRELDEGDLIARLGGDEFGILLGDGEPLRARRAAEALRETIDAFVFSWEGKNYSLSASIGMAFLDRPGLSPRELLAMADTACYFAKERGRNRLHVFEEGDAEVNERRSEMEWIGRIRKAMEEGRLSLDYQELHPLRPEDGGAHFELLLRMRDEQGQPVAPGMFIPAAERFGLMPQLDRWVVETALSNFSRLHPQGDDVELCAINLSGATVDDEHFAAFVLEALQRHRVPARQVCFEITETAAVSNLARVLRFIERLRAVGCRFALDDFGAGMSSFGYLKNIPVDLIKIDGSFIRQLEDDAMSQAIVRAIADIGHQVGLQVIAEWVNTETTRELLRELGVDFVQGFMIHKPEPALYCR